MNQQTKIWVVWSAKWPNIKKITTVAKVKELWSWIAKTKCLMITGSCNWLPNEAAIWSKWAWWFVVWLSPAFSEQEHIEVYHAPLTSYDIVLYTWKWVKEKSLSNVRSVDAIIVVWGGVWTLNEFTIAYDEWKIIWILESTGWISDHIPELMEICNRELTGNIIISKDPRELVEKVVLATKQMYVPIEEDERVLSWKWA